MDMNDQRHRPDEDADFERRARAAFDASVDELDAATRSRLNRARQRALAAATGRADASGSRWWATWAPAGAVAAAALAAVLLWRSPAPEDVTAVTAANPPNDVQQDPLELLAAGEDLDLAAEADLDFYAWVELATADDGVG
jgi:hypothetical protein